MKNIRYIILTILAFGLWSCSDFLEQPSLGSQTEENYYEMPGVAMLSVGKCYESLSDVYGYEWPRAEIGNMATDDSEKGGSDAGDRPWVIDLGYGRALPTNSSLEDFWAICYKGIGNCNIVLENFPKNRLLDDEGYDLTEEVIGRYLAEVRFLRAYYYFDLARVFGGVPLVKTTQAVVDSKTFTRASSEDTYKFINSEFEAITTDGFLPSHLVLPAGERGRVTQEVAWSMLARVNLFFAKDDQTRFALARDAAWKVIDSKAFSLDPEFQNLFLQGNYSSVESVFVNIRGDDSPQNIHGSFIPVYCSPRGPTGAYGFDTPTLDLVSEFEMGDPRFLFTVIQGGDIFEGETLDFSSYPNTGFHSRKAYLVNSRRGTGWGDDAWSFHIIRYADVLLMYAEALLESGGSKTEVAEYINKVRRRAKNSSNVDVEADYRKIFIFGSLREVDESEDLRAAVRHERRVELAMEYQRFYDLVRWGTYVDVMNDYMTSIDGNGTFSAGKNEVFPIPQTEIDRTDGSIKQNPNY